MYIVWTLDATPEKIAAATAGTRVYHNLYWQTGESLLFDKVLNYLEAFESFGKARTEVSDMLADPNLRYAYAEMLVTDRGVEYASLWICSAKGRKLAYLSAP